MKTITLTFLIGLFLCLVSCSKTKIQPDVTPPGTTNPPTTGTPPIVTPPVNPPVTRPAFLPKYFDEKPSCLLSKVTIENNTIGTLTKTTNTYTYDTYNRFTQIKSTTEGVAGEAVTSYVYKDSERKIEVTVKGFTSAESYTAVALLNTDYTINEVTLSGAEETSKTTYAYNSNGEVISEKYDSNIKSYEVVYTYGDKGIIKSERRNYVGKASPAPDKEDITLEWTYSDSSSVAYNSLVLSTPNFPSGYIGKLTTFLPSQSKVSMAARITSPIVFEYSSTSNTDYKYTNNTSNKVIRIDTDTNANSSGVAVNVKTKIDLEYK